MVHQVPVSPQGFDSLQQLKLQSGEVVMYCKFVLLKQNTLTAGQAKTAVEGAPAVLLLGDKEQVKAQLSQWLEDALRAYNND
jgi:hypothetical protein